MSPQQLTPEQKKARFEKAAKVGIALGLGLLVSPVIYMAIGGLIGLSIAAAIVVAGVNLAPVFARKMGNWKMKLLMAEARANPIETMLSIYTENMKTIQEADGKIRNFAARLGDFADKVKGLAEKFPAEAERYKEMVAKLKIVLDRRIAKQRVAKVAATKYHDNIEKAKAIYEIAKEANGLQELAGDMEKQVFQDIQKEVAFDTVNHEFNLAVSELSLEVETDPDFTLDQQNKANELSFHSGAALPTGKDNGPAFVEKRAASRTEAS